MQFSTAMQNIAIIFPLLQSWSKVQTILYLVLLADPPEPPRLAPVPLLLGPLLVPLLPEKLFIY